MEKSIVIRDTGVDVIDILKLMSQGYSYYQILMNHPALTLGDIMLSAKVAQELIENLIVTKGVIRVEGAIEVVCSSSKRHTSFQQRERLPRACQAWSTAEDREMVQQYRNGLSLTEIARLHGRGKGAIRTRLRKLGVGGGK